MRKAIAILPVVSAIYPMITGATAPPTIVMMSREEANLVFVPASLNASEKIVGNMMLSPKYRAKNAMSDKVPLHTTTINVATKVRMSQYRSIRIRTRFQTGQSASYHKQRQNEEVETVDPASRSSRFHRNHHQMVFQETESHLILRTLNLLRPEIVVIIMTHQAGNTDTDRILGTRDDTVVTLRIVLEAENQSGKHLRIYHHTVMPAGKTPHDRNVAGHSNRLQILFCITY